MIHANNSLTCTNVVGLSGGWPSESSRLECMARTCSVCAHPDHLAIDAALLGAGGPKRSHRDLALHYGLSRAAVQRHAASHVPEVLRAVQSQAGLLHAETMLTELGGLYERTVRLLDRAEAAEDHRTVVAAIREARQVVESFAKVGLAMANHQADRDASAGRADLDDLIERALEDRMNRALPAPPLVDDEVVVGEVVEGLD